MIWKTNQKFHFARLTQPKNVIYQGVDDLQESTKSTVWDGVATKYCTSFLGVSPDSGCPKFHEAPTKITSCSWRISAISRQIWGSPQVFLETHS